MKTLFAVFFTTIALIARVADADTTDEPQPRWEAPVITLAIHTNVNQSDVVLSLESSTFDDLDAIGRAAGKDFYLDGWTVAPGGRTIFISVFDADRPAAILGTLKRKFSGNPIIEHLATRLREDGEACEWTASGLGDSEIAQAIILASSNADYGYCIRRTVTHAMGLLEDLPAGVDSIRSIDSLSRNVTEFDLESLRALYE